MIECEVKLKIENKELVKSKLISLGFAECDSLTETDTYFDNSSSDIRTNDRALRIRATVNHTAGNTYCQINFKDKKLDDKSMSRHEYENEISDANSMTKILNCLGFFPVTPIVKKERIFLRSSLLNACIDTVDGLGDFIELEAIVATEEEKEEALDVISGILDSIGYSMSDTTRTSYLSMLQRKDL